MGRIGYLFVVSIPIRHVLSVDLFGYFISKYARVPSYKIYVYNKESAADFSPNKNAKQEAVSVYTYSMAVSTNVAARVQCSVFSIQYVVV